MKTWLKESTLKKSLYTLCALVLIANFQNCAAPKKDKEEDAAPPGETLDCVANPGALGCPAITCHFNGQDLATGQSITAFQNSTVPAGSTCVSESRTCNNGLMSGSYAYASCDVGAEASCLFDGKTIAPGDSVNAYQNSTVAFGSTCVSESRTCVDGSLSGSYSYAACAPEAPASCLFNGQTLVHGASVSAFPLSTVPYGSTCQPEQRVCNNGTLTGQATFATCNVQSAQSCLFDGQSIAHGQTVDAYQTSSVAYGNQCVKETRTCDNGVLSGSNSFSSCNVSAPDSCLFNGATIAHGETTQGYLAASVPYGSTCQQEARTCDNGVLSGSYGFNACVVSAPASCSLGGQTIPHSSSILAFASATAPSGGSCVSESRYCDNGTLSGSYQNLSCTGTQSAANCTFNNQSVADGASVVAYLTSSVPYGSTCTSENRTCSSGTLSGSYTQSTCTVAPAASCTFNGQTIASGGSVTAYKYDTATHNHCQTQTRTCSNGSLSGSFTMSSCQ